jgi:hypothetical protein
MRLKAMAMGVAAMLALAACSSDDANSHDIKGVPWKNPDKIEVYANVDGHPNITRLCIGGVAFATTSRDAGVGRVVLWRGAVALRAARHPARHRPVSGAEVELSDRNCRTPVVQSLA